MIHRAHPCMPASDSTAEEEEDVEHLMIDIS
jgi:hypothetical protein